MRPSVGRCTRHTRDIAHRDSRRFTLTDRGVAGDLGRQCVGRDGHVDRLGDRVVAGILHDNRHRDGLRLVGLVVRSPHRHTLAHEGDVAIAAVVIGNTIQNILDVKARHRVGTVGRRGGWNGVTCRESRFGDILHRDGERRGIGGTVVAVGYLQANGIVGVTHIRHIGNRNRRSCRGDTRLGLVGKEAAAGPCEGIVRGGGCGHRTGNSLVSRTRANLRRSADGGGRHIVHRDFLRHSGGTVRDVVRHRKIDMLGARGGPGGSERVVGGDAAHRTVLAIGQRPQVTIVAHRGTGIKGQHGVVEGTAHTNGKVVIGARDGRLRQSVHRERVGSRGNGVAVFAIDGSAVHVMGQTTEGVGANGSGILGGRRIVGLVVGAGSCHKSTVRSGIHLPQVGDGTVAAGGKSCTQNLGGITTDADSFARGADAAGDEGGIGGNRGRGTRARTAVMVCNFHGIAACRGDRERYILSRFCFCTSAPL